MPRLTSSLPEVPDQMPELHWGSLGLARVGSMKGPVLVAGTAVPPAQWWWPWAMGQAPFNVGHCAPLCAKHPRKGNRGHQWLGAATVLGFAIWE